MKFKKNLVGLVLGAGTLALTAVPIKSNPILRQQYFALNGTNIGSALPVYQINGTNNVTMTNGVNYVLRLQLDFQSNDVSNVAIKSGTWGLNSIRTQYIHFIDSVNVDARIPVMVDGLGYDFWDGYTMDSKKNYVDTTLSGTSLTDSSRSVTNNLGPINRVNYIEDIYFTTLAETTTTNTSLNKLFGFAACTFYSTNSVNNDYGTGSTGIRKLALEPTYVIVNAIPEPSSAALFGLAAAGAYALRRRNHKKKNDVYSRGHMHARDTGRRI